MLPHPPLMGSSRGSGGPSRRAREGTHVATWGPEPGGQGSDLRPQAVLFRDTANSWFEAGALSGRVLQNSGQEGRPPHLWRLWPAHLPLWGLGPLVRDPPPPPEGRRERGWGARAAGCVAPSPGHPEPRAPCGQGPALGRDGSALAWTPCRAPEAPGGKPPKMTVSPPPQPFWGESLP